MPIDSLASIRKRRERVFVHSTLLYFRVVCISAERSSRFVCEMCGLVGNARKSGFNWKKKMGTHIPSAS